MSALVSAPAGVPVAPGARPCPPVDEAAVRRAWAEFSAEEFARRAARVLDEWAHLEVDPHDPLVGWFFRATAQRLRALADLSREDVA